MLSNKLAYQEVKSDRLFHDKFEYCLRLYVKEVSALRMRKGVIPSRGEVEKVLKFREELFNGIDKVLQISSRRIITNEIKQKVFDLRDYFDRCAEDFKIYVCGSTVYVYTNSNQVINDLVSLCPKSPTKFKKAIVVREKDTITLRKPKYKFRTFLKAMKCSQDLKEALLQQIKNNAENVQPSRAMQRFFDYNISYSQAHYYIDHNDEKWLLLVHMVCPGLIRKTMPIIATK